MSGLQKFASYENLFEKPDSSIFNGFSASRANIF